MVPVLGICGASGSGKTTLLCRVISHLASQGLKVGALKHHGHAEPLPLDQEGKDSDRLLKAGAARAILVHAGGLNLTAAPEMARLAPRDIARSLLGDLDLALVEGYKTADLDKIEVVAPGREPLLPRGGRVVALARRGGSGVEAGRPVLDADDPSAVAAFILERLAGSPTHHDRPRVTVRIEGVDLPMKPFVADLVEQTLRGMLCGLKGGQGARAGRVKVELG